MAMTIPPAVSPGGSGSSTEYNQLRALVVDPPFCKGYQSGSGQVLGSGSFAAVSLNAEVKDNDGIRGTSDFVIATPGWYRFMGQVAFPSSATGRREAILRTTAGTIFGRAGAPVVSGEEHWVQVFGVAEFAGGEAIQMQARQNSGGNLTLVTGVDRTWLTCEWFAA